jgi:hypothetical protein
MPPLPPELEADTRPGGEFVLTFPRRDLGAVWWLPGFLLLMAVAVAVFLAFWCQGFVGGIVRHFGPGGWISAVAVLPGLGGIGMLIGLALAMRYGRGEIQVRDGQLIARERLGALGWSRSLSREAISKLLVSRFTTTDDRGQTTTHGIATLLAERATGKPFLIAIGYPRPWLLAVADRLATELQTETVTAAAPIAVVDVSDQSPGEVDRFEQPADSAIDYQPLDDGFAIRIPPRGVWRGSGGLFAFSLIWLGFMVIFTATWVVLSSQVKPADGRQFFWIFAAGDVLFWLIGLGMLLASLHMGRRQAAIGVTNGELKLMLAGPFGTVRKDWRLADLQTVRVGPSGMAVNDVPVLQLYIVPRDGPPYGLLTGRDVPELEWLATMLRQSVKIPS